MNQEISKLVEESFLLQENKNLLLKLLEGEGATEKFFKYFEHLLTAEIKNIGENYNTAITALNGGFEETDKWLEAKKKELDGEIENKIDGASPTDMKKKNEIWAEYDKKFAVLSAEYKKRIDAISNKLMIDQVKSKI